MGTLTERRKEQRYYIRNYLSCALVSPIILLSYRVLDISYSGLSFSYAGWEDWPSNEISLDLIGDNLYLKNIPFKVIADIPYEERSKLRRCSVEFTSLGDSQAKKIKEYVCSLEQ